jgi:hypothetical protein
MVLGGAVGGVLGYVVSEIAVKVVNVVWPRKVAPPQELSEE